MCWSCATPLTIRSLPTSRSPAPARRWAASCFDGFLSSKKSHFWPVECVGGGHWPPAGLAQQRVFREGFSQTNGQGRAMLAPTKVFLQPKKKLQAGDLLACNFFIPRRGSFSPFPAFYCPASAICSRVMGSS